MHKFSTAILIALAGAIWTTSASAQTVNQFIDPPTLPATPPSGQWFNSDVRGGGTTGIVDLTGQGGNLESNAPLPNGAARLTTGADNADKAEVAVGGNFGTISDFLSGGSLSYDYFKSSVGDLNASAAAAIKLAVFDTNTSFTDDFGVFVFEPTWNLVTPPGGSVVPTDDWLSASADGNSGIFWSTGIYDQANQAGGPGQTLDQWFTQFGDDFLDASIIAISVGVGSFNQGQTAYFDNVQYSNLVSGGRLDLAYDFEVAPVPVPAALPLLASVLGFFGLLGWRRRSASTA